MTLVFDTDRSGTWQVWTMTVPSGTPVQLTRDPLYDAFWARLSPDRSRILFYRTPAGVHDSDPTQLSLWIMQADGSNQRQLLPAGANGWLRQGHVNWLPDGQHLVVQGGVDNIRLYITDADGQNPRAVASDGGTNVDPSASWDGSRIVYAGCPQSVCYEADRELYSVPSDGGTRARLTTDSTGDYDPAYAPDGRTIAWLKQTSADGNWGAGVWNVFLMNSDGTNRRPLTNDSGINSQPNFTRDGGWILFHRLLPNVDPKFNIYAIRPDGTGLLNLTGSLPGNCEYPSV